MSTAGSIFISSGQGCAGTGVLWFRREAPMKVKSILGPREFYPSLRQPNNGWSPRSPRTRCFKRWLSAKILRHRPEDRIAVISFRQQLRRLAIPDTPDTTSRLKSVFLPVTGWAGIPGSRTDADRRRRLACWLHHGVLTTAGPVMMFAIFSQVGGIIEVVRKRSLLKGTIDAVWSGWRWMFEVLEMHLSFRWSRPYANLLASTAGPPGNPFSVSSIKNLQWAFESLLKAG